MKKNLFLFLFAAIFFILSLLSALHESLTFDEVVYLQEGRNAVLNRTFDIDPYNPPLSRDIAIFPYIFQKQFYQQETYMYRNPLYGRVAMILLGVSLLVSIYFFAKKYFGEKEAIFSLILFSFEPNLLANSHYITMDIGVTLFFFLSFFLFTKLLQMSTVLTTCIFALSVGFGMATKILFIPYFFLSCLSIFFFKYKRQTFIKIFQNLKIVVILCLFIGIAIWSAYFFHSNVVIKQRQDNSRVSVRLENFAKKHNMSLVIGAVSFLEKQPIPLGDYLATLKNNAIRSLQPGSCFFLGKTYSSCRWYFMPVNFFLKTPLPLLLFFSIALLLFIQQKKKNIMQLYLFIPIGAIFLSAMFFRLNPLVRYMLPVFPFIILFASLSIGFWMKNNIRKFLLGALLLWYIVGTLSSFPHFISFANELTFGQKQFVLTDSNMDWGQSLLDVKDYVQQNKTKTILFSYFGRDNGNWYGLQSNKPYGSYKNSEICEFHTIGNGNHEATLISISNWYNCGYNQEAKLAQKKVKKIIGQSILVF